MKSNEAIKKKINELDSSLIYLGGYSDRNSKIKLKCMRCGYEFERVYERLVEKKRYGICGCPRCAEKDGRNILKNKLQDKGRQIFEDFIKEYDYELIKYTNTDDKARLKCLICGDEFDICAPHNFMTVRKRIKDRCCPMCEKHKRDLAKALQEQSKRVNQQQRQSAKELETVKNWLKTHTICISQCANCGAEIYEHKAKKFCSARCSQRYGERHKAIVKDKRIKNRKHDVGITLDRVYKRAKGICYICGQQCNYEDYIIKEGNFIAGNSYPSIEHIIPIAKGGTDTWLNVGLAHRGCNSKKGAGYLHQFTLPV